MTLRRWMLAALILTALVMIGIAIYLGDRILVFMLTGFIMGMFFEREFPPLMTTQQQGPKSD